MNADNRVKLIDEILNLIAEREPLKRIDDEELLQINNEYIKEIRKLASSKIIAHNKGYYLTDQGYLIWAQGGIGAIQRNNKAIEESLNKMDKANQIMEKQLTQSKVAVILAIVSVIISLIANWSHC